MNGTSLRFTILLVVFHFYLLISSLGQGIYDIMGKHNMVLYGHSFFNITNASMEQCLGRCLENCLCLSFQICKDKKCQLCSSNEKLTPSAFQEQKGCTYFVFQKDNSQIDDYYCQKSCSTGGSCCMTSNPCLNGGTCEPSFIQDHAKRFRCRCPPGYHGDLCQSPITSCRGYINGTRNPGKYRVFDDDMKLFEVYCDFDNNSTMAWTLVQSYELAEVETFRESFYIDLPINGDNPSWKNYRLSKRRMEWIQRDSSKWRMTCEYDKGGLNYTDFVQVTNNEIDILTFNDGRCIEVEYIDVRGESCYNCTAYFLQRHITTRSFSSYLCPLHSDSSLASCFFSPSNRESCFTGGYEDNFGYYYCVNSLHRCSSTEESTSQTWFGGR